MKHLFAIFLGMTLLAIADGWHQPQAKIRIFFSVNANHATNLLVPVPEEYSKETADVFAVCSDGTRLPASPVIIGGKCLAAAVNAAKAAKNTGEAYIYLLSKPMDALPYKGSPIMMLRTTRELTTRAHTAQEMLRMLANLYLIPYPRSLRKPHPPSFSHLSFHAFGDFGKHPAWATVPPPEKGHSFLRAFSCATASIAVTEPCNATFSADQTQVAWTILLDGLPVANWTVEGAPLPQSVALPAGLHVIQLLAVQSVEEPYPKPVITCNGKPLTEFLPATLPRTIGIDFAGEPPISNRATLTLKDSYSFLLPEHPLNLYGFEVSKGAFAVFLDTKGNAFHTEGSEFTGEGPTTPSIRFKLTDGKTATFHGNAAWKPSTGLTIHLTAQTPPIHDVAKPLPMTIRLDIPRLLPESLRNLLELHCTPVVDKGDSQTVVVPMSPNKPIQQIQLPLPESIREYNLELFINSHPVCQKSSIAFLAPSLADTPLTAQGEQLYLKAMLTPATLLSGIHDIQSSPTPVTQPAAIFDDGLLSRIAPQADFFPKKFHHISATVPSGTRQTLAMAANLHKLLEARPSNAYVIASPETSLSQIETISYVSSACKAHGIRPVLVTIPDIPGNPLFANAKTAALKLKSLAMATNTDCLDLHTRAILDGISTDGWDTVDGIRLNTINNTARHWLFQHLDEP